MPQPDYALLARTMAEGGQPEIAIDAFLRAVEFVAGGGQTLIPEDEIEPVAELPGFEDLAEYEQAGRSALAEAAVIKLNGGLGTSMGLSKAKSLLPVRDDATFLDLIVRQVLWQRRAFGVPLPLVLMNSYRTRDDALAALAAYPELTQAVPHDFIQHRVPRIDAETFAPVEWPSDPTLEWCPPGHGDLYIALESSGMLRALQEAGIRYAFVSNSDNLGAVLEPRLLGWLAATGKPFVMEVTERTPADRKGGHLALRDGRFILRETAQCAPEDLGAFQDETRHRYFNTNNLWMDLEAIAERLRSGGLQLPVMRNEKHVSSTDPSTPRCYQLETAMGAAIGCFPDAGAVAVPRTRFAPVKTTSDLLVLWSDAYRLAEDGRMLPADLAMHFRRLVDLDPRFYGGIDDLQARFAHGAPSLRECELLRIRGDHYFGADVVVRGAVELVSDSPEPVQIPAGAVLE